MKRFFNFLLINIAILGLSGLNIAYADTGNNFFDSAKIEKVADFIQKRGHDVFEEEKTGRGMAAVLGWEQDHPEWTERINYHFLIKAAEMYKNSEEEMEIIFHRIWLSPSGPALFADNPQFKGLKETDLFFKAISTHTRLLKKKITGTTGGFTMISGTGKIMWVFYYRNNLREDDSLSAAEAKDEFSKELNWWIEFIDNVDKK